MHITFVCTGNICRSPMAAKMFAHQIAQRGLSDVVRVTSAGTDRWHVGNSADERTNQVLRAHGFPTDHCAAQFGADHLTADLVVALGRNHARRVEALGVPADRIRMLRSFEPDSGAVGSNAGDARSFGDFDDVEDPYYGDDDDFTRVFTVIEAALPGLHTWVDERLAADRSR